MSVIHGTFFCFAAAVLLVFVSVSVPVWDKVSFLDVDIKSGSTTFTIQYGVFGYTGSETQIGYTFPSSITADTDVFDNLTKALILHPIAAGLSGLSAIFGICGAAYSPTVSAFMTLFAALAELAAVAVWVIDMVLFTQIRDQFNDDQDLDYSAQYGNALWLTLGAMVALLLGSCMGIHGAYGARARRDGNVVTTNNVHVWFRNAKSPGKRAAGTAAPVV